MAVMYVLGGYVFSSDTALPKSVQRDTSYRWAKQERLNRPVSHQPIGVGEDTQTMEGVLYPCEETGRTGKEELAAMRATGSSMLPLNLIDGNGYLYGLWCIKKISEGRSHLWANSDPRKISFTIDLTAYGADF